MASVFTRLTSKKWLLSLAFFLLVMLIFVVGNFIFAARMARRLGGWRVQESAGWLAFDAA